MASMRALAGVILAAAGLQANAQTYFGQDPASRHFELYKQMRAADNTKTEPVDAGQANSAITTDNSVTVSAPYLPPLVATCQQSGQWKGLPSEDFSAMNQLGRAICTDTPFATLLPEANGTRSKYFAQLSLAYDYVSQRAQLGRALESAELDKVNLPNVYVTRKPNASENGGIIYSFEMTMNTGTGKPTTMTGLLEVARKTTSTAALH